MKFLDILNNAHIKKIFYLKISKIFISFKYFFSSYNDDLSIFLQPLNIV